MVYMLVEVIRIWLFLKLVKEQRTEEFVQSTTKATHSVLLCVLLKKNEKEKDNGVVFLKVETSLPHIC